MYVFGKMKSVMFNINRNNAFEAPHDAQNAQNLKNFAILGLPYLMRRNSWQIYVSHCNQFLRQNTFTMV